MIDSVDGRNRPIRAGVSWSGRGVAARRGTVAALAVLTAPVLLATSLGSGPAEVALAAADLAGGGRPPGLVSVIVREADGAGSAPERVLDAIGGSKQRPLGIINGYTASVPAGRVQRLRATPGVFSVTPNATVQLADATEAQAGPGPGSMYQIAQQVTGAADMWARGITGEGVDVALIDSGVVPVDGLSSPGKVVNGPDFSLESIDCVTGECTASPIQHLDAYGHGTHMAGIIAGRDSAAPDSLSAPDAAHFLGMAPDARIVNLKVADAWGTSDVAQVIAAIDWVVQNRRKDGLNIRVLNLSFGTNGVQSYLLDPLTYAAETAWHQGIVVVVSAGNEGYGSAKLNNPAYDPYVIAVGGANTRNTYDVSDDVVADWSSTGDGTRNPDLVAPGASVLGLRSPGSFLDVAFPKARVGNRFFRGSGTSQAGAVVSGAAALVIQQRPRISPDQVKALLMSTARPMPLAGDAAQGAGLLDLRRARDAATPSTRQRWTRAEGTGSLEAARGTYHITIGGQPLVGEAEDMATVLKQRAWMSDTWTGHTWNGQSWQDFIWGTGDTGDLVDTSLLGRAWSGRAWSGRAWSGRAWSGAGWAPLETDTP